MTAPPLLLGGRPLLLGDRIGKGGEGDVYAIVGRPEEAVKLYTVADLGGREAKVLAMIRADLARDGTLVAYPRAVVTDRRGAFAGFVMRLVSGHRPIHHLYSILDRKSLFPQADYAFLVHTARNVAAALATVHARDCVVGDINHSGILVSDRAMVALIDADSFQMSEGSTRHLCRVGVQDYTPPELQGRSLDRVVRTTDHDAFGLAVIVFQLLCLGRHPFAGSHTSRDMTLERAVAEHRFAYSRRRNVGMTPPPGAVLLSDLPEEIGSAFEAAFAPAAGRPTAAAWVGMLKRLGASLRRCAVNAAHVHPTASSGCPWCRMERTIGLAPFVEGRLFGTRNRPDAAFDARAVWAAIDAVALPPTEAPEPRLPSMQVSPGEEALRAADAAAARRGWGVVVFAGSATGLLVLPGGALAWLPIGVFGAYRAMAGAGDGVPFATARRDAEAAWRTAREDWSRRCGAAPLRTLKKSLADAAASFAGIPGEHREQLAGLERNRRAVQMRAHLERHRLAAVTIKGIGPGLKTKLRSWGIESAFDVEHAMILRVDGIGEAKARLLLDWRNRAVSTFRFDARPNALDVRERDRIDRELGLKADALRARLTGGAAELRRAASTLTARREAVDPALADAHAVLLQAQVDDEHVNAPLSSLPSQFGTLVWVALVLVPLLVVMIASATARIAPAPRPAVVPSEPTPPPPPPPMVARFAEPVRLVAAGGDPTTIRAAPSSDAAAMGVLRPGRTVRGIGTSIAPDGSRWTAVSLGGTTAFLPSGALRPSRRREGRARRRR